ncbi:hypothetical protein [Paenarthrobacter sp. Y-19]|jgi:hypothetical protein|uniref:hypothetical protein n=1 Tax=Paenarthrobacter sp. Y-19 TaxID=3031125 RepID=UPI0003621904|nr:hypothetical protein [Paenarthrobacter sp. Y-19]KQQ99191.1 hypothetical protein ASF74_11445 [Arthrobacter sp. Leaf145]BCW40405.1 hypothetical protein StoSoilB3_19400 [Arthrobacter sp. StoSoilB3]
MTKEILLTDLPSPITTYLDRSQGIERKAAIDTFDDDALVVDDGRRYRGTSEIVRWLDRVVSEFEYTTTFLGANSDGRTITVVNRLEGTFPGGIVELKYRFVLNEQNDAISELTIAP